MGRPATASHADGGNNKQRSRSGQAAHAILGMQNRTRADEADAGNNLGGNARMVANKVSGNLFGKDGEHGGAKADKHVGAQARRTALQFTLQPDDPAQKGREHQPKQRLGKQRCK